MEVGIISKLFANSFRRVNYALHSELVADKWNVQMYTRGRRGKWSLAHNGHNFSLNYPIQNTNSSTFGGVRIPLGIEHIINRRLHN